MPYKVILSFLIFIAPCICQAYEFYAKVISVRDGDTIEVSHRRRIKRIRLHGIDCPEINQHSGRHAKRFTSKLALGKKAKIIKKDIDKYGRIVAEVFLDNTSLNRELVKNGWAWHYVRYSSDEKLDELEKNARQKKLGLWQKENPLPPWEFRKQQREPLDYSAYFRKFVTKLRNFLK